MGILSKIKEFFSRFTKVKPLDVNELLQMESKYSRPAKVTVVPLTPSTEAPSTTSVETEAPAEAAVATEVPPSPEVESKRQQLLKRREELIQRREAIKQQMQELEKQYRSGVLSDMEYDRQFAALLRQAVQIRRELSEVEEELMSTSS
ncbi:MAG: hypothetical protein ACP6IS_03225 [Candidatus Asgardarchaeia archaeon]